MIKNVVLDMGGVCCRWDPVYLASRLTDNKEEQDIIKDKLFGSLQWQQMDQGLISEKEALEQICNNITIEYHNLLKYAINHWYDYFEQFDDMYLLVKELKEKNIPVYLLSNCSSQFNIYSKQKPIFALMDGLYISANSRLLKPDSKIYLDFVSKFNLKKEECLFVDDMLVNVKGATNVGMTGYHYQGDIDNLKVYIMKNVECMK